MNVYEHCPMLMNECFRLELVSLSHCSDLLKVYSDVKSVPLFNSDNCGGDDFYYSSTARMQEAIEYWLWEYSREGFVRMSIFDIFSNEAIGTIEMFRRIADDYFTDTVLLRLDLRSDYEKREYIESIVSLVIDNCFDMFPCKSIATKAVPLAIERIKALEFLNFNKSNEFLIGHDGKAYSDYYIYYSK